MSDLVQEKCLGCSKDFHINEIQAHVRQNQECRKKYDKWSFNRLSPQEKCLGCSRNFPINGIQTHLRQKQECRKKYSQDEFNKLKQLCEAEVKKKLLNSNAANKHKKNQYKNQSLPQKKCLGCLKDFPIIGIQTHLRQKQDCRKKYSSEAFNELKQFCAAESKRKKSESMAAAYQSSKGQKNTN